jgi:hypothetical protein
VALEHLTTGSKFDALTTVEKWSNHFNEQDDRCYLRVDFLRDFSKAKAIGFPIVSYQLFDVLEFKQMATCTDWRGKGADDYCQIKGEAVPCHVCATEIEKRMSQ